MSAATASYDAVAIRDRARELGFCAEVDHSPVWGSPFKHVFVFLTEARWDGRLVQISPEEELVPNAPADSLIVGERVNATAEAGDDDMQVLDSADELMAWLAAKQGGERS
jgi:hypothetical protein